MPKGKPTPGPQLDSQYGYPEQARPKLGGIENCVMGSADHPYGYVDGFKHGVEQTGYRHKKSALGKIVRGE